MEPVKNWTNRLIGGRYKLKHHIATTGMSSVFKAFDRREKRFVAVKIATNNHKTLDVVECLRQEASSLRRINHPRVVRLIDFGYVNWETYFLVMEYLPGYTLANLVQNLGRLPVNLCVSLGVQILDGLDAIHKKHLVHRDIKPENVMIGFDGAKIIDFGLAASVPFVDRLSDPGVAYGTLPYIAPEHLYGSGLDYRSDLYSCGVVLYKILTGVLPFRQEPNFLYLGKAIQYWIGSLRSFEEALPRVFIPRDVKDVVWKALEADPQLRYQTAKQMRAALLAASLED